MKKITIVTMQLKKIGGIERFVTTLADMLAPENEVTVAANYGKPSDPLAFEMPKNVKIQYLSPSLPQEVSMKKLIKRCNASLIIKELKRRAKIQRSRNNAFKQFFGKLDTDIIITERAAYSSLVAKYYRGGAKLIATDHNFHQNQKKYIKELLDSLKKFDFLVVGSKELFSFYKDKTKNTKCVYIPNPLAEIPVKKSDLSTKNIISVGRFVKEKDFLTLVDVMKKITELDGEVKLFLVGDGEEFSIVREKIKALGLEKNIVLTGALNQKELAKYYLNSSLYVMTSKTEAFGLVLAEAMSYGLPCVAFDRASGAREQIKTDMGLLIKDANVEKMAGSIVELLNNPQTLKKYQKCINEKISDYGKERTYQQWHKIIQ